MDSLEVVAERIRDHDRRILEIEQMVKNTAKGTSDLLIISTKHSEQLEILKNIVYGGLGLAITTVLGIIIRGH